MAGQEKKATLVAGQPAAEVSFDGVFQSKLHYQEHTGVLTHEVTQPSEDLILNRNAEMRKNPGILHDLGGQDGGKTKSQTWGRWLCSIPNVMYEKALRDGYQLNCPDKEIRSKELYRYLQSEEGKKCLVQG